MTRGRQFPFDVNSVGAARRFAADALGPVPTDVLDAVALMVSELATNSIRHAKTGFHLAITAARDSVRVEVTDVGGGVPEVRSPAPTDPTGRGLRIVQEFSDEWGIEYDAPRDKTVWFKLAWAPEPTCTARPRSGRRSYAGRGL
jgi:anti-sigma regulatory factor (Ser/Thr protein kinase)